MIPTENLTWIIAAAVAAVVIVVVATVIVVRRRRAIASRRRDELEAGAPTTEAPEREADETLAPTPEEPGEGRAPAAVAGA